MRIGIIRRSSVEVSSFRHEQSSFRHDVIPLISSLPVILLISYIHPKKCIASCILSCRTMLLLVVLLFAGFPAHVSKMRPLHRRDGCAGVHVPAVDATAHTAPVLLEAVEAAEGEAPGPAAHAVPVCGDASTEVLPAEAF